MANYRGKRNSHRRTIILLAAAAVTLLSAAVYVYHSNQNKIPQLPENDQVPDSSQTLGRPQAPDSSQDVPQPEAPASSAGASPDADAAAAGQPEKPRYDFSQPAPESGTVDNSYFDDAAFVGDSRTSGFMLYSGIGTGQSFTSNGLSIFSLAEKKVLTIGGENYTLLEALAMEEYGKVYLSLGVNELGVYKDQSFYNSYCEAIDQIRILQPRAVIYIQGLIPLNEEQIIAYNGNKFNLTNEHLRVYNDLMRQAAEEKQVVYLDLYSEFADENGILPEGLSRDGVHLKKEPCQQWLAYLKSHTVDFDTLYPDGPPMLGPPGTGETDSAAV